MSERLRSSVASRSLAAQTDRVAPNQCPKIGLESTRTLRFLRQLGHHVWHSPSGSRRMGIHFSRTTMKSVLAGFLFLALTYDGFRSGAQTQRAIHANGLTAARPVLQRSSPEQLTPVIPMQPTPGHEPAPQQPMSEFRLQAGSGQSPTPPDYSQEAYVIEHYQPGNALRERRDRARPTRCANQESSARAECRRWASSRSATARSATSWTSSMSGSASPTEP